METFDALVVGGGFFGGMIARHLSRAGRVLLVEEQPDLLRRASYHNQARVHHGYHYPRSLLTGLRSRANYARFLTDFAFAVDRAFAKVYAVGRAGSKVTAAGFELFCRRIGAALRPAPRDVERLFEPAHVEAVYLAEEAAFDAVALRGWLRQQLDAAGVTVWLSSRAERVEYGPGESLTIRIRQGDEYRAVRAARVFHCAYSRLNELLRGSGLPAVALKHELTELALVEVPAPLRRLGVTVMCGPFFSLMPFPAAGLHTLSHVRYTPHAAWLESDHTGPGVGRLFNEAVKATRFEHMRRDAARYLPLIADVRHRESLWEVKTVLPANETDDGRPILFRADCGLAGLHCVLGAKIDNVYDVLEQLDRVEAAAGREAA